MKEGAQIIEDEVLEAAEIFLMRDSEAFRESTLVKVGLLRAPLELAVAVSLAVLDRRPCTAIAAVRPPSKRTKGLPDVPAAPSLAAYQTHRVKLLKLDAIDAEKANLRSGTSGPNKDRLSK